MAIQVNRINPARLSTPAEINQALESIADEISRLKALTERVKSREKELMAEALLKNLGDIDASSGTFDDIVKSLVADAMAYRDLSADTSAGDASEKDDSADEDDATLSIEDIVSD